MTKAVTTSIKPGEALLKKTKSTITVLGIVVPVDWDREGRALSFAVSTYEEQEYLIDITSPPGMALTTMPQQKIKITGTIGKGRGNKRILKVVNFEPV